VLHDDRRACARSAPDDERPGLDSVRRVATTAIAAEQGLGALLVCWGGIAAVNVADALRR
jgi:hypothetical protein